MLFILVALVGCGPNERYKALEAERDALQSKLKEVSDQDRLQRIRADALSLVRRICSNSFDPVEDIKIADEVLDAKYSQIRLGAFKDDTATLESVLRSYEAAAKAATVELQTLSAKLKQQLEAVHAMESEINSISGDVDPSSFLPTNLMLARKFGDKGGYSSYEAFDFSKNRKVVALVPNEFEISLPYTLRSYAKSLGDQPFQSTISNNFRSFEQTDYFPVLKVANKTERLAITGGADELQRLRQEVAQTEARVKKAIIEARVQVQASIAPMSSDIRLLADAADCATSTSESTTALSSNSSPQSAKESTARPSPAAEGKEGTSENHNQLSEECKRELKEYIMSDVGVFTKENEIAIVIRCQENPEKGLCFAKKVREAGGSVSFAERGHIELACGF